VFPASGDDRWVAIACRTDEQRAALEGIVGTLDDDALAAWTAARSPDEVCAELQALGVPAHPAQRSGDMVDDPQLRHLGHFRQLPHPELGDMVLEGPRVRYSRTPAATSATGPTIGQHSEAILKELLGYDDERFVDYVVAGAIA
jgi:crotonobetainyl-CoA:carnitine CoA-transferase CaiB-like acyl-CoA transferase